MKIYTKGTALAAAAVFALATAAPAIADHDTSGFEESLDGLTIYIDCTQFGGIRKALEPAYVAFANDKDRLGLNGKLDNVHNKYLHAEPPKVCDAAQKFDDFSAKVVQLKEASLGDKKKIWNVGAEDAITCLIDGSAAYAEELRSRDANNCTGDSTDSGGKPSRGNGPK